MADIAISNLNQIEEVAIGDVLAIDDISAGETKKIPFESLQGGVININPTFSIWQENTTFTNPAHNVYSADGYLVQKTDGGGTAPSINVKKNTTDMETGFAQCCELEITNVGSAGTTRTWRQNQYVEDFTKHRGETVIVTIRVAASTTINLTNARISVYDGVGLTGTVITSVTADYITYSVTRTINDAATMIRCTLSLIETTGEISTTGSIYIQWMKLELGSVATPLIPRSTGEELALCQRYYQKSYAQGIFAGTAIIAGQHITYLSGLASSDHTMYVTARLPVVMKAAPTVTLYDAVGNSGKVTMIAGNNIAGTVSNIADSGFMVYGTNGAVSTVRQLQFHYIAVSRV